VEKQIAGEEIHFFIRLSNQAVTNSDLLPQIEQLIFGNALDPQRLTFEFPEKTTVANPEQTAQLIQALDQLGCASALYNFGGSANATQLIEKLEIRYIKLLGSLATQLSSKPHEMERVVKTLQRAANAKGVIVIASEVNDAQTLSTFWKYGIDYIQGNHIQAPQSKPDYEFG
jgi:EAL domain-containing protein (putative c-di-GMP-specific phosphodiesterase class I)